MRSSYASTSIWDDTGVIFSKISVQKFFKKTSCQDRRKKVLLQDKAGEEVGVHCLVVPPYFKNTGKTVFQPGVNVLLKRYDWGKRGQCWYDVTRKQQKQHWSSLLIITKQSIKIELMCSWGLFSALRAVVHGCSGSWSMWSLVGKCTDYQRGWYFSLYREAVSYRRNFYVKLDQVMTQFF